MKTKICKYSLCGLRFVPSPRRFNQQVCDNIECAKGYAREKMQARQDKDNAELLKAMKESAKTLEDYKSELQDLCNKIVRLIDKGHPCISSNRSTYTVHAGHLYSRGSNRTLQFHLLNIFAQCSEQNTWKGGSNNNYRDGIIKTFGQDLMNEIDSLPSIQPIKLSKADIVELKIVARQIIKELEGENRVYTTAERISKRREYNLRLNIYTKG